MKHSLEGVRAGDTVVVVSGNRYRGTTAVRRVTRVGRKYLYADGGYCELKFEISNGREPTQYGSGDAAYTPAQYAESQLRTATIKALHEAGVELRNPWNCPLTTDQLTALLAVVQPTAG